MYLDSTFSFNSTEMSADQNSVQIFLRVLVSAIESINFTIIFQSTDIEYTDFSRIDAKFEG